MTGAGGRSCPPPPLQGSERPVFRDRRPCGVAARGVYADGVGLPPCRSCFLSSAERLHWFPFHGEVVAELRAEGVDLIERA